MRYLANIILIIVTLLVTFLIMELILSIFFCCYLDYTIDEELYWKISPSQTGYQCFGHELSTIDKYGARKDLITNDEADIISLGDSITFGWGLSDTETYSYIIEKNSNYSVVNFGNPGWGLFQELIIFLKV